MQQMTVDAQLVEEAGVRQEGIDIAALQQRFDMIVEERDKVLRQNSGSRPPAPEYCTAAQSPTATAPFSRISWTDTHSPAWRTEVKPGVTGAPV